MAFIDSLNDYKREGVARFATSKQTTSAIVKELLPQQLTDIKKNYLKFTKLIDLLNYYVEDTVPKINTRAMLQSWVRKLVKERYSDDSKQYRYLKIGFSMSPTEKKDRETKSEEKLKEKNENQLVITTEQIKAFKNQILSLIATKFKIIPALIITQLASGCRLIEILNNDYEFEESKREGYIIQSDVAKNRTGTERPVEKPILFMNPNVFLKLIKKVRQNITHKAGDTNIILSNRYDKRVNAVIKKIATQVGLEGITSSHDLRKIYGNYSYKKFAPDNCSLQAYLSTVLGHESLGAAAANYSTISIQ